MSNEIPPMIWARFDPDIAVGIGLGIICMARGDNFQMMQKLGVEMAKSPSMSAVIGHLFSKDEAGRRLLGTAHGSGYLGQALGDSLRHVFSMVPVNQRPMDPDTGQPMDPINIAANVLMNAFQLLQQRAREETNATEGPKRSDDARE